MFEHLVYVLIGMCLVGFPWLMQLDKQRRAKASMDIFMGRNMYGECVSVPGNILSGAGLIGMGNADYADMQKAIGSQLS